jgi:CheY-like chemotaxis protein
VTDDCHFPEARSLMSSAGTKEHPVLIVEDHDDTRHMVQEVLELAGLSCVSAANGVQGLSALHEYRPCLILLDLTMPIMDGWRFREEQQRLADPELARAPVLILSALSDCIEQARRLGAVGVIPKPVDIDRMVETVRSFCQRAGSDA